MNIQNHIHFTKIADAIEYIKSNFKNQPNLEELAKHVHLSPAHFQRLFTDWAGTSPKKFLQYISIAHAKKMLKTEQASLFDTTLETGLSSTSRLHDLFIKIEGMTPAEFKNEGKNLLINYSFATSPFGKIIIATTSKGICNLAFIEDEKDALNELIKKFPYATFQNHFDVMQKNAILFLQYDWKNLLEIKLHLKGSAFQLKVWEALLNIPIGKLSTYGNIAVKIDQPRASRAVGTAIGNNPVAFLIPCHRVIQSSGNLGGYMWGTTRKAAIIGWESAKTLDQNQ